MKRSFLDITHNISRSTNKVTLLPVDLNNDTYWIFGTSEWLINTLLSEMQTTIDLTDTFTITINQQFIPNKYYIVETTAYGINIKFIKNELPYLLAESDVIALKGNIRKYV